MSASLIVARLAAFALCAALLAAGLHWTITRTLRSVATSDLGAFNRAMQGRVNADIVVTGSSRAFRHYDPRVLGRELGGTAFNFGLNASQIDVQLGTLKSYLAHNRKPRLVIQNLDIQSFLLTHPGDIFNPSQYVPYLGDPDIRACLAQIEPDLWKWERLPLYAYAVADTSFTWTLGLRKLAGLAPREDCIDGFCPMDRSWTREFEQFKRTHPDGLEIAIEPKAVADLEEIVTHCQQAGIAVVLVYSPQFHEMVALTKNRAKIFSLFHEIAERHHVPFLDYTDSPLSMNRDLFYNAQHLNARGAEIFSEDVAKKLGTIVPPAGR